MFSRLLLSESLLFESLVDLNEFGLVEEEEERTGLVAAETLKLGNDFFPISSPLRFELTENDWDDDETEDERWGAGGGGGRRGNWKPVVVGGVCEQPK